MDGTPLRRRLLASVSDEKHFEGHLKRLSAFLDLDPASVRRLLRRLDERDGWLDLAPRVREIRFQPGPRRSTARCSLVRLDANARFTTSPDEDECWVFVLDGMGIDRGRAAWLPGDLLHLPMRHHDLRASGEAGLSFVRMSFERSVPR